MLDSVQTINVMGNVEVKHDQRFSKPYTLVNDILLIHPTAFVEHVRGEIDKAFIDTAEEDI